MADTLDISIVDESVRNNIAHYSGQFSKFTQEMYYLAIYDIANDRVLDNLNPLSVGPSSASGNNYSPEYYFRLPPKVHEMGEPFATSITMTQDGGKYVESQGSPSKEIRLSGSTGLRAGRNSKKSLKLFGFDTGLSGPIAQTADFVGIGTSPDLAGTVQSVVDVFGTNRSPWDADEPLGHDDIQFLRNMFRLYSFMKQTSENAAQAVMLWRNARDGDYWLVEPMDFRLTQNAASPLTYEYSITLKTLAKWDYQVKPYDDPLKTLRDVRNLYARVNQTTAVLQQSFLFLASKIDRFSKIPQNISDFVLGPLIAVVQGSRAVSRSSKRFSDVFSSNVKQLNNNLREYMKLSSGSLPPQSEEMNALRKAYRATNRLMASSELNGSSLPVAVADSKTSTVEAYNTRDGHTTSPTFVGNQSLGNSIAQDVVSENDDIRSLAQRLLGDRAKYHILVLMNNLQAPYITPQGGLDLLKPGDTVLYPRTTQDTGSSINSMNQSNKDVNKILSAMEHQYGRDLRLKNTVETTSGTLSDLVVNQDGDISTVSGLENITQAVKIKFSTKRGELPAHQFFGALYPIGTKATPSTLVGFRLNVEQTLLSDSRISSIRSLSFKSAGDTLSVNASVSLTNSSSGVRLNFPIRSL